MSLSPLKKACFFGVFFTRYEGEEIHIHGFQLASDLYLFSRVELTNVKRRPFSVNAYWSGAQNTL